MIQTTQTNDRGLILYQITDPSIPISLRATWSPQRAGLDPGLPPDPNNARGWFAKNYLGDGIQLLQQLGPTQFAAWLATLER